MSCFNGPSISKILEALSALMSSEGIHRKYNLMFMIKPRAQILRNWTMNLKGLASDRAHAKTTPMLSPKNKCRLL